MSEQWKIGKTYRTPWSTEVVDTATGSVVCRAHQDAAEQIVADRAASIAQQSDGLIREHLARICGAFTGGVYCTNCGDPLDDCDCIIGEARHALIPIAPGAQP